MRINVLLLSLGFCLTIAKGNCSSLHQPRGISHRGHDTIPSSFHQKIYSDTLILSGNDSFQYVINDLSFEGADFTTVYVWFQNLTQTIILLTPVGLVGKYYPSLTNEDTYCNPNDTICLAITVVTKDKERFEISMSGIIYKEKGNVPLKLFLSGRKIDRQ